MSTRGILTVLREGVALKTQPVHESVILGRSSECAIRLDDRSISRQHAIFKPVGEEVHVENKSDFAPILINGAECRNATLKNGDVISIGPYLVRFSSSNEKDKEQAKPIVQALEQSQDVPQAQIQETPAEILTPEMEVEKHHEGESSSSLIEGFESAGESSLHPPAEAGLLESGLEMSEPAPHDEAIESHAEPVEASQMIPDDGKTKIVTEETLSVKLVFQAGAANVTEFEIKKDLISIGRGKTCDIILNDKKSSRKNSTIQRSGLRFQIKDLESVNGTFVNGIKVQNHELSDGDQIKIGDVEFQFLATSANYGEQEKDFLSVPEDPLEEESLEPEMEAVHVEVSNTSGTPDPQQLQNSYTALPTTNSGFGITGVGPSTTAKRTLLEKFRALPKRTQYIGVVAAILFLMWLNEEDEAPKIGKPSGAQKAVIGKGGGGKSKPAQGQQNGNAATMSFESLPADKKQFIEAQHQIAFDFYKNKEYDKAIFEIEKIFAIVSDYKDSKEIERYAKEGKRKMEALDEERKKKESEVKLKEKIADLVADTKIKMDKKEYEQAKENFSEILSIDPDNIPVATWRKELEAIEENKRIQDQQKEVQVEINQRAWALYQEALLLKKERKYHSAIHTFQQSIDIGASDPKLLPLSKKMIAISGAAIRNLREPLLEEAKKMENTGEFSKAFALFQKATRVDPPHPEGYAGMKRIRGVLHDRAKAIYTEAILAESYSDFTAAKRLFEECLRAAPSDDLYYERAQRKLAHYFKREEGPFP